MAEEPKNHFEGLDPHRMKQMQAILARYSELRPALLPQEQRHFDAIVKLIEDLSEESAMTNKLRLLDCALSIAICATKLCDPLLGFVGKGLANLAIKTAQLEDLLHDRGKH